MRLGEVTSEGEVAGVEGGESRDWRYVWTETEAGRTASAGQRDMRRERWALMAVGDNWFGKRSVAGKKGRGRERGRD